MARDLAPFLKIRHLSLVLALVEHSTMHRAAEALNMTQSTASKMLRDIEDLLGASLFTREPRGMRPTELGHVAARFAENTLGRLHRFSEEFEDLHRGGMGTLVIGAIMGAAPDLVAGAVTDLKARYPMLTVRLLGETSDGILEMLETGEVDIAVGRFSRARHREMFTFEPLAEEPLALVTRTGHPLAGQPVNGGLAELANWPWILQPPATPTRKLLEDTFRAAALELPRNQVESVSMFAILHLLQSSDAVALLPESVVGDHLRAGLMVQLSLSDLPTMPGFGLLFRRDAALSFQAELFCQLLRARVERRAALS